MRILALEPYFGGSHQAFLEGWSAHSRHDFTTFHLPPRKWKWRMRHAAVTLSDRARTAVARGRRWDALLCSDMLNLAEFLGLAPPEVQRLPAVAYFHENQLTYPYRDWAERDLHFGLTNMTTALAATEVWFNSAFHRDDFIDALTATLKSMPDFQPLDAIERIRASSRIEPPGVATLPPRGPRAPGPLRILWAARWEHDKNPQDFFDALRRLRSAGVDFRMSVIGEQFQDAPPEFSQARQEFAGRIDHWGYQATRTEYVTALSEADVFVSTALHEFFGVSAVEAIMAGCRPMLPQRLAYPELLELAQNPAINEFFYGGSVDALTTQLAELAARVQHGFDLAHGCETLRADVIRRYQWETRAAQMDAAFDSLLR